MEHQIIATWAQVGIGIGQLILISWGLWQMKMASEERNRQLDIMEAGQREQSRAQSEALGKIGQALDRRGEAMTKAFTQQGQALERQGEVLAELLRRTA